MRSLTFHAVLHECTLELNALLFGASCVASVNYRTWCAGVGNVVMGGVGVVTLKKDITSIKTLHLTLAVVVGLLSCSYTNQVSPARADLML